MDALWDVLWGIGQGGTPEVLHLYAVTPGRRGCTALADPYPGAVDKVHDIHRVMTVKLNEFHRGIAARGDAALLGPNQHINIPRTEA